MDCKHAITTAKLVYHFQKKHPEFAIDPKKLKKLGEKYVIIDPREVSHPSPGSPEVPYLNINRDGYRCNLCPFASGMVSTIQRHVGDYHKDSGLAASGRWSNAAVQTFYYQPNYHYFVVTPNEPFVRSAQNCMDIESRLHSHSMLLQLAPNELAQMDPVLHPDQSAADQISPWLKETGWHTHLAGQDLEILGDVLCKLKKEATGSEGRLVTGMLRVFERCTTDVESDASYHLLRLANSSEADRPSLKPFKLTQQTASHTRYLGYWVEFIKYVVTRGSLPEELLRLLQLTPEQSRLSQIAEELLHDRKSSDDDLDEALEELSMSFIRHRLVGNRFQSALMHYLALKAVNPITKGLADTPRGHTNVLVGIRYCSRLFGISAAIRTWNTLGGHGSAQSPLDLFRNDHTKYFCTGSESPLTLIGSQIALGIHILKSQTGTATVTYIEGGLSYRSNHIYLDALRQSIHLEIGRARSVLSRLYVPADFDTFLDFSTIRDDSSIDMPGYGIFSDLRNGEILLQAAKAMMSNFLRAMNEKDPSGRMFNGGVQGELDGTAVWAGLEQSRVQFLKHLMLLVHMTGGGPARGTELTGLSFRNLNFRTRNIFLLGQRMAFVTRYHKGQAISGTEKFIPRFLPEPVGKLLMAYLIYVVPFMASYIPKVLDGLAPVEAGLKTFLWFEKGKLWKTAQLTSVLEARTELDFGFAINTASWRHISIALQWEHLGRPEICEELDDDYPDRETDDARDLQAGHSTGVANRLYAVRRDLISSLSARSIQIFGEVSNDWHELLWLAGKNAGRLGYGSDGMKRPREIEISGAQKRSKLSDEGLGAGKLPAEICWKKMTPEELVCEGLERLFGPDARCKSAYQEQALLAVIGADARTPLVIVQPTGAGKSVLFMLPSVLREAGKTIVVLPYVALIQDIVRRCQESHTRLKVAVWEGATYKRSLDLASANLVLVGTKSATNDSFQQWVQQLELAGRLDRIVIDECHLAITATYRPEMQELKRLRNFSVPTILLTATLPPYMQRSLEETLILEKPLYLRTATYRTNISYMVFEVPAPQSMIEIVEKLRQEKVHFGPGDKAIIFCRTKESVIGFQQYLKCGIYISDMSPKERRLAFDSWAYGNENVIAATTALGAGIDIPSVRLVIHYEEPYTATGFAQESGRAGRDGLPAKSMVFLLQRKRTPMKQIISPDLTAMYDFITTKKCRREILSKFLDGGDGVVCLAVNGELCDLCYGSLMGSGETVDSLAYFRGPIPPSPGLGRTTAKLEPMACPQFVSAGVILERERDGTRSSFDPFLPAPSFPKQHQAGIAPCLQELFTPDELVEPASSVYSSVDWDQLHYGEALQFPGNDLTNVDWDLEQMPFPSFHLSSLSDFNVSSLPVHSGGQRPLPDLVFPFDDPGDAAVNIAAFSTPISPSTSDGWSIWCDSGPNQAIIQASQPIRNDLTNHCLPEGCRSTAPAPHPGNRGALGGHSLPPARTPQAPYQTAADPSTVQARALSLRYQTGSSPIFSAQQSNSLRPPSIPHVESNNGRGPRSAVRSVPGYRIGNQGLAPSQLASQRAAVRRARLIELLDLLRGGCSVCWVAGLPYMHDYIHCRHAVQRLACLHSVMHFRDGLKFESGAACYRCYLPRDDCRKNVSGGEAGRLGDCQYKDLVLPAFLSAFNDCSMKERLVQFMGVQDGDNIEQIKYWLTRKVTLGRRNLSNLWLAFEHILGEVEGSEAG